MIKLCPKHNKRFPCGQCRIESAQKPPQKPVGRKSDQATTKIKVPVEQVYCLIHAKPKPCSVCIADEQHHIQFIERNELMRVFNQVVVNEWQRAAKAQRLDQVPKVGDWESLDKDYDTEKFRKEINLGLRGTKTVLKKFGDTWQGFDDLCQIVDIEIWKATRKYKEKMNGAIAYTIAKNQGWRFVGDRTKEQMIGVENSDGSPVLDEFGNQEMIPRYISLDDRGFDEQGEPRETNPVEDEISVQRSKADDSEAFLDHIRDNIGLLQSLVSGWFGAKRAVGEAILTNPETTVRGIPGVPKSTAGRLRRVVLEEFRSALKKFAA